MDTIITLTTDFGWDDQLVGAMKGSILTVNPQAKIVDITHSVSPHNIVEGALILKGAYCYFPPRTIHLAVVDPGVGGTRRPLAIIGEKHRFIGPDNGLFSLCLEDMEDYTCIEISANHYFRRKISPTFHGRDIFGPVAGWLSRGIDYKHLGETVNDPMLISLPAPIISDRRIEGQIIHIDRFGNLVTNIGETLFREIFPDGAAVCRVGGETGEAISRRNYYGEVNLGQSCYLFGSSGYLEVAVNQNRAVDRFSSKIGQKVYITSV